MKKDKTAMFIFQGNCTYDIDDITPESILISRPIKHEPKKLNIYSKKGLISVVLTEKLIDKLKEQIYIDQELESRNFKVVNKKIRNVKLIQMKDLKDLIAAPQYNRISKAKPKSMRPRQHRREWIRGYYREQKTTDGTLAKRWVEGYWREIRI